MIKTKKNRDLRHAVQAAASAGNLELAIELIRVAGLQLCCICGGTIPVYPWYVMRILSNGRLLIAQPYYAAKIFGSTQSRVGSLCSLECQHKFNERILW